MDDRHPDWVVEQTIHGYMRGHQLLASSVDLDDEAAGILGHNSDSAPRARASDGAYLTGYPLQDGRYVLARTWPDVSAERPNTVMTRSALLPREMIRDGNVVLLLEHLNPPTPTEVDGGHLPSLRFRSATGDLVALSPRESREAIRYYNSVERLTVRSGQAREDIAMAVWQQLWASARYRLHFCTAPDTTRFIRTRWALLFTSDGPERASALENSPPDAVIERDLQRPGAFREFIQFVGSGETAVELINAFAEAFELLHDPTPRATQLSALLDRYSAVDPLRLRRLKRWFFSFERSEPRWAVDSFDLLEAVGQFPLGTAVLAADASLDQWIRRCWERDPRETTVLLVGSPTVIDSDSRHRTAAEQLRDAFTTQATTLITPATLALAADMSPEVTRTVIWDRNSPGLWREWARLDTAMEIPSGKALRESYDWAIPLAACRFSARALSHLLRSYPEALDHLIVMADSHPAESDFELNLTYDAKRYIRHRLERPEEHLVGLARLSDHDTLPSRLDLRSWRRTLSKSKDETVHATGYLIARSAPKDCWEVAATSTAALYKLFGMEGRGQEAWRRLSPHIRGDRHTWDRCKRLVEDYADVIQRLDEPTKLRAIQLLDRSNKTAADALAKEIRTSKSKKFRIFDPWTW